METEQDTLAFDGEVYPLAEFLQVFGNGLLRAVSQQNPPAYQTPNEARQDIMNALLRAPYPPQADCVQALCALLMDRGERAAILNAEMGTGKTIMGIAAAAVLHQEGLSRTLILSPPHLVYKWRREILITVPDAEVWVLNGPDTLAKLIQLQKAMGEGGRPKKPTFYVLGRVRMRMGFNWKPAAMPRRFYRQERVTNKDGSKRRFIHTYEVAACPTCGEVVTVEAEHDPTQRVPVTYEQFLEVKKRQDCVACDDPLWTLAHKKEDDGDPRERVVGALKKLPTIGPKTADKLVRLFGPDKLRGLLADNVFEFINLMDEDGELYFSDRQAARMERAFAKIEFSFGQGEYQPTEFVKRYLPKNTFGLCLVDEGHEYKAASSAQGLAMASLVTQCEKTILLTGTLMGGYADDLFYLLWRLNTQRFIEDGFVVNETNSLSSAANSFMEQHGVLLEVLKEKTSDDYKAARGTKVSKSIRRAPGFGPEGIARYVLPYTAFLKLSEIGGGVLPGYEEHFLPVEMSGGQAASYRMTSHVLTDMLKKALVAGDSTLLGVVLNVLLRRPDTCFREETIVHPRTREPLLHMRPDFEPYELLPKEMELVRLCQAAKARGRRVLAYTIYTGQHDLARRYSDILKAADFKPAVLRASVKTSDREDWIADKVDQGADVLITNPELVKTGLDLLEFPDIAFMQTGYSVFTLQQAARRSWRIGQDKDVDVSFLGYEQTAQMRCLSLMAEKIGVAQSTSGTMPETGLDVLNQSGDSVEVALAKQLVAA